VIALALVGSGLQSPSPTVPAVLGGLILLNAVTVDAPLAAFRVIGRRGHRNADVVLLVVGTAAVFVPGIDLATRVVQACCLIVFATVVFHTNYEGRPVRNSKSGSRSIADAPSGRSDEIGRAAGRMTGKVAGRARLAWQRRQSTRNT
jgi:hypothetical protein